MIHLGFFSFFFFTSQKLAILLRVCRLIISTVHHMLEHFWSDALDGALHHNYQHTHQWSEHHLEEWCSSFVDW